MRRMISDTLQKYLKQVKDNYPDPSDIGGDSYTAGTGIDITENVISVDNTVALKEDIITSYDDLSNKPDLSVYELKTDAFSGDYDDLTNKPTIPTVNNNTITITQGGVTKGSFTLNQNSNATIDVDAGGSGSSSFDDIVLDYSTTMPDNLPQYLELTQAQYNTVKQHVENQDYNIRLIIIVQGGPAAPASIVLYPNWFFIMGGTMNSDSGFFGKCHPNYASSGGGNIEFWGTTSIYYDSSDNKYKLQLNKFKVAYTV